MAFPGTYNFNYYKADTYEFRVYPKNASGSAFDLAGFTPEFTISTARGTTGVANQVQAYSEIPSGQPYILCAIRPADGGSLVAGTSYVYDIEITKAGATYPFTYTILTGNITVTDQVTGAV
jgi:hypothetical protein